MDTVGLFFLIILWGIGGISGWLIILSAFEKDMINEMYKSFYKVKKSFKNDDPDGGKSWRGEIVKIETYHKNDKLWITATTPITRKVKKLAGYKQSMVGPTNANAYQNIQQIPVYQDVEEEQYRETRTELKYLKKIKEISNKKGGEIKVRRMPRLFKYALYAALVVLVWDLVLNANNITDFVVHTLILHK